jgi:Flp pilus assembly protein TadB
MRMHPKGLLVLAVFIAVFAIGVDWRWGIAGVAAVAVIDFLSLAAPFSGAARDKGSGRKVG